MPEGKITGWLKLSLPNGDGSDQMKFLQQAQGQGEFKAPLSVVRMFIVAAIENNLNKQAAETSAPTDLNATAQQQADSLLQKLLNKGLLKIEGSDYIMQLKLENQQLLINGQPLNSELIQ